MLLYLVGKGFKSFLVMQFRLSTAAYALCLLRYKNRGHVRRRLDFTKTAKYYATIPLMQIYVINFKKVARKMKYFFSSLNNY